MITEAEWLGHNDRERWVLGGPRDLGSAPIRTLEQLCTFVDVVAMP